MLLISLALLVTAVALYLGAPSMLIYSTYPWPVYVLLIASVAFAFASRRRGVGRWVTVGATGVIAGFFIVYTVFLSRLAPYDLSVHAGDPFPEFQLQTSTGELFSPSQIKGKKAALYIFYRGDW